MHPNWLGSFDSVKFKTLSLRKKDENADHDGKEAQHQ